MQHLKQCLISGVWLCLTTAAQAYTVERFTPQGDVGVVRAAVARFSEPMNPLGAQTAAPFDVTCSSSDLDAKNVQKGTGRWLNEREWEYRFDNQLPVGSACNFTLKGGVTAVSKSANSGKPAFSFATGGPAIVRIWPEAYRPIDEQQMFVVHASGPLDMASVAANVRCTTSKLGEQIGVDIITGKDRDSVLAAVFTPISRGEDKQPKADRLVVLRCKQALGDDAQVKILWGKGVATPAGVLNNEEQQRGFRTQAAFRVTASCEREQAGKPCIPVRPITLNFTASVPIKWAKEIRLKGGKQDVKTTLDSDSAEPANLDATTTSLKFAAPLEPNVEYRIVLPAELADIGGRKLANASAFPMSMATGPAPALAKFAARFGIVERAVGVLPVTLRNVENPLGGKTAGLLARELATSDDAQVARLMLLSRMEEQREWQMRSASLLGKGRASKPLPALATQREAEVIGIPLQTPGLHVVEIESPTLGAALLDKTEARRSQNMYVRGYALVTGMAVHFKLSAENAAVWVTSLETGKPVASAAVQVSDCNGKSLWKGSTDASGIARINAPLVRSKCSLKVQDIQGIADGGSLAQNEQLKEGFNDDTNWLLASARTADDYSFALSSWTNGIEPWRFSVNTLYNAKPEGSTIAHTIFARNLLRQGETVHMKHLLRTENSKGLALPPAKSGAELYDSIIVQHIGSDQTFKVPLKWLNPGAAVSEWKVPEGGKLGMYSVALKRRADATLVAGASAAPRRATAEGEIGDEREGESEQLDAGSFQVAQFRLPTMQGSLSTTQALINVKTLPLSVQMNYLNGGAAASLSATVSALLQPYSPSFNGYNEFNFDLPGYELTDELRATLGLSARSDSNAELIVDKAAIKLNDKGLASQPVELAKQVRPVSLRAELNYRDPNGEVQTISNSFTLWPAKVVLGYKQGDWFTDGSARLQRWVVLDISGKPVLGASVVVQGVQKLTNTVRKRTVGGFYTYDSSSSSKDLGTVCEGKTDAQGMFVCELSGEKFNGNILLIGRSKDADGNTSMAGTSLWLGRTDYFKPDDSDRMDVLAEKRVVNTGDVARFQVRVPFANATAWVAVEREGVIDTFAVELSRSKPTIDVPIKAEYAPNVYVSVLAIRPRLQPLSWWSFFDWGWKSPLKWWRERKASRIEPTAMVDLAKPAYRLGLAELQVNSSANTLKVEVSATPAQVQTREVSTASMRVLLPGGKPVPAGTRVAVAVVDEALLELKANDSWDLLSALWRKRSYGVETATGQMQVIGKRHFGLKALPPGGGGGRGATRELLDTLVYWNPEVALDADGRAQVPITLNDSLTKFRVVVLADVAGGLFGSGSTFVTVAKDLQLISGLPPLVRDEDQFTAGVTLRNTTARAMKVAFSAKEGNVVAFEKTLDLAPQSAAEITWPSATAAGQSQAQWLLSALELGGTGTKSASDTLKVTQKIVPATPVVTWAATLLRVEQAVTVPVQSPVGAILTRGGVKASFASSITGSLDPVRDWFVRYPFYCLEQRTSKAVGLRDPALWKIITDSLPTYLDTDGLANYFPGDSRLGGSDVLTTYVLAAAHEAGWQLPEDSKARMLAGLEAYVQGKIKRDYWAPQNDDAVRRIAALEALSRYGRATPAMLSSINVTPNAWPTSALIDYLALLQRVNTGSATGSAASQRDKLLGEVTQVLRARMGFSGTRIAFDDEKRDYWWWLMVNSDTNAARLVLAALDNKLGVAEWLQDMPRLVNGLVARQQRGVWSTTTANLWGSLALEKYAAAFERQSVSGQSTLALDGAAGQNTAWQGGTAEAVSAPWPKDGRAVQATVSHSGSGKPYVTLQAQAAVPEAPQTNAGYKLTKSVSAVSQKTSGTWARGDVYRVDIEIFANAPMSWVALSDPIPGGSTILGSGLRDSAAEQLKSAQQDPKGGTGDNWSWAWLAYEERSFEGYRAYYEYLPKGSTRISYTVRLNQAGSFALPATRAEAMYAPEVFGSNPNARWTVAP